MEKPFPSTPPDLPTPSSLLFLLLLSFPLHKPCNVRYTRPERKVTIFVISQIVEGKGKDHGFTIGIRLPSKLSGTVYFLVLLHFTTDSCSTCTLLVTFFFQYLWSYQYTDPHFPSEIIDTYKRTNETIHIHTHTYLVKKKTGIREDRLYFTQFH